MMKHIKHICILVSFVVLTLTPFRSFAREVELSWEPTEKALGYHVFVSKTPDFKEIVYKKGVKDPSINITLEIGNYFYKVRAIDQDKQPGHWSEPMKFTVTPYPPELKAPKNDVEYFYYEVPPTIDLEWKAVDDSPEYEVFIYKTTGQKFFEQKTKDTKLTVSTLEEGEYLWKIRTIYKEIYESNYGEPRRITIVKRDVQKPVIISPNESHPAAAYHPIKLEWQKDSVSHYSDIEMSYVDNDSGKTEKIEVEQNLKDVDNYELNFAEPGKYKWKVRAKESETSKGQSSDEATFDVRKDMIAAGNSYFYYGVGYQTVFQSYKSSKMSPSVKDSINGRGYVHNITTGYFLSEGFGLQLDLASAKIPLDNVTRDFSTFNLSARLRFGPPGFTQTFYFGYRQQNTFEIVKDYNYESYTTTGGIVGTEFAGSIARDWRLGINAGYYKPLNHTENRARLTGDAFDGKLFLNYNVNFKFWVGYEFQYHQSTYNSVYRGAPDSENTSWTNTTTTPVLIKIGFEN